MKYVLALLLAFSLAQCGRSSAAFDAIEASELRPDQAEKQQLLVDYFEALTALGQFNGVLLAAQGDTILVHRSFTRAAADSSLFVTTDYAFDIHSVSKMMTHYLILKLETEGALTLETTLDAFFPDFPQGHLITIEQLLDHQSGLPRELMDLSGDEYDLSPEEIVALAQQQTLLFDPGTDAQYSNVGYEILYQIIALHYDKPFAQCVVDEIFTPFGMQHSGAHFYTNSPAPALWAKNHQWKDGRAVVVPNILQDEFRTARMYSTTADLFRFLTHIQDGPYAAALANSNGVIAKDGGSKGIRAQVYADTKQGFSYVFLANFDEMPFFQTVEEVAKILSGQPVELPRAIERKHVLLEDHLLRRYEGSYVFPDFDGLVLAITVEEGDLLIWQDGEVIARLKSESETVFFEDPSAKESFEFVPNESGTFDALMGWKGISVPGKRI